jgi:hypothetical protein
LCHPFRHLLRLSAFWNVGRYCGSRQPSVAARVGFFDVARRPRYQSLWPATAMDEWSGGAEAGMLRRADASRCDLDPPTLENRMSAKERFVLASAMSSVMVAMVTLVATWLNLGLRHDFVLQWAKAYVIAWPIAAVTGFLVMPMAQRLTIRILTGRVA